MILANKRRGDFTEQSILYPLVPLCAPVIIEVTAHYVFLWRAHAKSNARSFIEKLKYHKVDLPDCYSTSRGKARPGTPGSNLPIIKEVSLEGYAAVMEKFPKGNPDFLT